MRPVIAVGAQCPAARAAVDEALARGPVYIVKDKRPQYVVLTQEHYRELTEGQEEAALARIEASLDDAVASRVTRHAGVDALLQHLGREPAR